MVRLHESQRVRRLHERKSDKQATEQQNFRREKQPHADLAGIELLFEGRKMMLQSRIVLGVVFSAFIHMMVGGRNSTVISGDGLVHLALASPVGNHTVHASKQDRNRNCG